MRYEHGIPQRFAISFGKSVSSFVAKLSQDEFTSYLHELRGVVREGGLHKMDPGDCDPEFVREIVARVALPPEIKANVKVGIVVGGGAISTALGTIPAVGLVAAGLGVAISISPLFF
jgi:hypothetical protein